MIDEHFGPTTTILFTGVDDWILAQHGALTMPIASMDGIAQRNVSTLDGHMLWKACAFTIEQIPPHVVAKRSISSINTS